eukprot:GILI01001939.1.p1 GENE.GILI01001939.1~~GILI01001939.1.p1  ORF type:complete len:346 (+),score=66.49 GILI01001939.1:52-1038(+)
MGEVLLYYKYVDIPDPTAVCSWQKELCERLNLKGRIRVAREGINGTVSGSVENIQEYAVLTLQNPLFADMELKTSPSGYAGEDFSSLSVRECDEIVTIGISPDQLTAYTGAQHLSPEDFHKELAQAIERGLTDACVLDCRNGYESRIGHFDHALAPPIRQFSDFPRWVAEHRQELEGKKVLMYCTGGVRCERGSAYLKSVGLSEVYQLRGGIHKYLEAFPQGGLYKGKCLVFDKRRVMHLASPDVVGSCHLCSRAFDQYDDLYRCADCRCLLLVCHTCRPLVLLPPHLSASPAAPTVPCSSACCSGQSESSPALPYTLYFFQCYILFW